MMKHFTVFLLLITTSIACSSTEQTVQEVIDEIRENYEQEHPSDESNFSYESLRTQLADAYTYRENEIPEAFNRIRVEQKVEKNLYEGYRIQIYSGEDVVIADTIAANFRAWSDTTISGYQPETYVFFRTPFYRVHVGDFHERERAIEFSNIVKRYYRDAWVVYDRVNPRFVPADTVEIKFQ